MSEPVIKIENISKLYRLGLVGGKTMSDDIRRWWAKIRHKEDPTLAIGQENILEKHGSDYIWALQNVNLDIQQGEVLGIIGKNGAGKSTLLKIISRITSPTSGVIKIKGRIASLLEVGTGFHPELTGRDNIFLNGTILGMTKSEIQKKLDEIIDFAGVERYIDTPVKRYSSGMYVRLAFAVAAHLEPEILVVDEVLAVGDAEFQKKAIGKMRDVSKSDGRTVLFVSHNMNSIQELCTRVAHIGNGNLLYHGNVMETIMNYLNNDKLLNKGLLLENIENREGNGFITFTDYQITDYKGNVLNNVLSGQDIKIAMQFKVNKKQDYPIVHFSVNVTNNYDQPLFHLSTTEGNGTELKINNLTSSGTVYCNVPSLPLPQGVYNLHLFCSDRQKVFDSIQFAGELTVESGNFFGTGKILEARSGALLVKNTWNLE